jgi:hypothetical protein
MQSDELDTRTATTLLLGKATATKIEIADTGVTTEIQGPLDVVETMTADDIDTRTATTLLLGKATATKVEIADTGVTTEVQGSLDVVGTSTLQGATTFGTGGTNFTFPATRGTNDQILKTDGTGTVTWQAESGGGGGGVYVFTFGGNSLDNNDYLVPNGSSTSGDLTGALSDVSKQMVLSKAGTITSIGYTKNILGTTATLVIYINEGTGTTHPMTSGTNYGTITGLSISIASGDRIAVQQAGGLDTGVCVATFEVVT